MLFFITIVLSIKQAYGWSDLPVLLKILGFFFCIFGGFALTWAKKAWKELRAS